MYTTRLRAVSDKLTNTEKKIASYLETNPQQSRIMTSYELAAQLDIGQSTIIRFSKKLGYNSFRDLQVDLINSPSPEGIEDISVDESTNATSYKITRQYQEIIDLTYAQNSDVTIEKAVEYIRGARRIQIHGIGNSTFLPSILPTSLRPSACSPPAAAITMWVYSTISCYGPEDLVILISESGETPEILQTARIAQSHGVPVISMTRAVKNKLYDCSDLILRTVNRMSRTRLETMTMRCSQLCLIDMIYLNLFKTDYSRYLKALDESKTLAFTKER